MTHPRTRTGPETLAGCLAVLAFVLVSALGVVVLGWLIGIGLRLAGVESGP